MSIAAMKKNLESDVAKLTTRLAELRGREVKTGLTDAEKAEQKSKKAWLTSAEKNLKIASAMQVADAQQKAKRGK
jgi:hypothetical protein